MHGIVMAAPGYFGRQGPFGGEWEHGFQSARAYYRAMEIWWRSDEEAGADPALVAVARAYAGRMRPRVEATFVPPRFTQANCHAEQFFAARTPGSWAVTGVVDMEVALGGWPLLDVAGIAFALSHPRFGGYRWWRPWFEGYGEPDIDLFRLVLAPRRRASSLPAMSSHLLRAGGPAVMGPVKPQPFIVLGEIRSRFRIAAGR
ncbi:MAG: hypothetical protein JO345_06865 [Streptosporangiaceae bacterium]|nr:hypothetical protein [Streptosporangiaceae bacterium]